MIGTYFAIRLAKRHDRKATERRQKPTARQTRIAEHKTTRDLLQGTYGKKDRT